MATTLSKDNIRVEIVEYLKKLKTLKVPTLPTEPLELFRELKRGMVSGGPYDGCSVFEVANRVMSDLVVFAAAEKLLIEPSSEITPAPLQIISVLLGTADGWDLSAQLPDGRELLGECFNVAPSFFATKFRNSVKALEEKTQAVRVISFNEEAVSSLEKLMKRKKPWLHLLPIDVPSRLTAWQNWI